MPEQSTLCLARKQGQTLVFHTLAGETIEIEFKKCKHFRTDVAITMPCSVACTRGELLRTK